MGQKLKGQSRNAAFQFAGGWSNFSKLLISRSVFFEIFQLGVCAHPVSFAQLVGRNQLFLNFFLFHVRRFFGKVPGSFVARLKTLNKECTPLPGNIFRGYILKIQSGNVKVCKKNEIG